MSITFCSKSISNSLLTYLFPCLKYRIFISINQYEVKIRITENQYTKLVKEQRISIDKIKKNLPDPLKKIAEAIIKRLTNPTSLDYKAIRNLSKEKLKKVLSYIPSKYKNLMMILGVLVVVL